MPNYIFVVVVIHQARIQSYSGEGAGCSGMQCYKCNLPLLTSHTHCPKKKRGSDLILQ